MSAEQCRDLNKLHPFVKKVAETFLAECKKQGFNIKISETFRSISRQDYLYAQGRTRPGNVVTDARGSLMSSYHQWGLAFDIYNDVPGDAYNTSILNKAGTIGQKMSLEWGGGRSGFKDSPHFQYTFGLSIVDLKAGKKPPVIVQQDDELVKAAQNLCYRGIIATTEPWNSIEKINLKYVPALLEKMSGIERLVKDKIISDSLLWPSGSYTVQSVRSLIIKYSKLG